MTHLLTPANIRAATETIIRIASETIPTRINRVTVSEWAEENRVLTEGPYPGPFSFDVIPYMREIADCLSETSNVKEIACLKGSQIAATVGLGENWIGYIIDVSPGPMMYVNGNADMAGPQMELRVDSMINNSGISHKIKSQNMREGQRKTGDVKNRKEFPGGWLLAGGPKSGMIKRSFSAKYIYADEIDMWPVSVGAEGDPVQLLRQRKKAYASNYKILWTTTPLFKHNSHIYRLYLEGDQRKYHVPCKHCGYMQSLKWKQLKFDKDENGNLIYKTDKSGNEIISSSVRYECEKCGREWKNDDKDYFLPKGKWKPTAKPSFPGLRSYHISGMLSPVGFSTWEDGVIEYLDAVKNNEKQKLQVWTNNFLGEPFEDYGEKINPATIYTRDRDYYAGTLPVESKPLFITIGADVQADRIECEIVAWGKDAESWSINYHKIKGDTEDIDGAAWNSLKSIIKKDYNGMVPILSAVDAGYRTDRVYEFCDSFETGVHPVMGQETISGGKQYIKAYPVSGRTAARIDVNTDLIKQLFYKQLAKSPFEDGGYPKGYCHFPIEYDRDHFNRLTAEQRIFDPAKKKWIWDAGGRRNEQLDCRIYNIAMLYAYRQYVEEVERERLDDKNYSLSWDEFWKYVGAE